jgi:DNA-binding IclR family transcriptional regulator
MTLAELTRSTGIPKPTVRRIAASLVARQLLRRCEEGYLLGTHLLELGIRAAEQHGLRLAAAPHIHDLLARTREVAWINAISQTTFTLVDIAFGANRSDDVHHNRWPTNIRSAAFLTTAAGRVLLAGQQDITEQVRSRPLPQLTPQTVTSWPRYTAALQVVRDTGAAVEHEQFLTGYSCVAVGLRSTDGTLIGTIGVTGRTGSFAADRLTRPLLAAASDIASTLAKNNQ